MYWESVWRTELSPRLRGGVFHEWNQQQVGQLYDICIAQFATESSAVECV